MSHLQVYQLNCVYILNRHILAAYLDYTAWKWCVVYVLVTKQMSYKIPPKQNIILKYVSSIRRYNYRQTQICLLCNNILLTISYMLRPKRAIIRLYVNI